MLLTLTLYPYRLNKSQERLIIDSSFVIDRTVLCAAWDEGVTVSGNL
ncbi:Uncharacterized protein {ECO:0000313/EMBL:CCF10502.1} [Pantoea ananatis]|nr:hypothetical protein PANA5342_3109 [Pantoea ananatis LMG 5342]CRH37546.1 Uncharacterized protein {ECO:0000313/EMBL:CCF10502.1} [Pantoea ananatis]